ncbi:MAG: hypothetical protein KGL39_29995 [Patescibacteria group bacterium]|nr:hypothetical protein [Patescibacteria group bacterium]
MSWALRAAGIWAGVWLLGVAIGDFTAFRALGAILAVGGFVLALAMLGYAWKRHRDLNRW